MTSSGNGSLRPDIGCKSNGTGRTDFERLTREHLRALWRTAWRMTGDNQLAEDLTQETCLRAYRAFDSFQAGTNYKAWIFRIMTNLCLDHHKRQSRAPFIDGGSEEAEVAISKYCDLEDRPDVQLNRKMFRYDAHRAIAKLPEDVRIIVSLSLLEEFSYQEIAEIVGCPIGTVRSRLNRGRQELRIELSEYTPASIQAQSTYRSPSARISEPGQLGKVSR